jgi:hypothetical protein
MSMDLNYIKLYEIELFNQMQNKELNWTITSLIDYNNFTKNANNSRIY